MAAPRAGVFAPNPADEQALRALRRVRARRRWRLLRGLMLLAALLVVAFYAVAAFLPRTLTLRARQRIEAPLDTVWAYVSPLDRWPEWAVPSGVPAESVQLTGKAGKSLMPGQGAQFASASGAARRLYGGVHTLTIDNVIDYQEVRYSLALHYADTLRTLGDFTLRQAGNGITEAEWTHIAQLNSATARYIGLFFGTEWQADMQGGLIKLAALSER